MSGCCIITPVSRCAQEITNMTPWPCCSDEWVELRGGDTKSEKEKEPKQRWVLSLDSLYILRRFPPYSHSFHFHCQVNGLRHVLSLHRKNFPACVLTDCQHTWTSDKLKHHQVLCSTCSRAFLLRLWKCTVWLNVSKWHFENRTSNSDTVLIISTLLCLSESTMCDCAWMLGLWVYISKEDLWSCRVLVLWHN